jgi:hypothetical protein
MSQQKIPIYPHIKKMTDIVNMTVDVLDMKLFESVSLRVVFYSSEDIPVDSRIIIMDKTNGYSEWSNDDAFIIDWVKKQCLFFNETEQTP